MALHGKVKQQKRMATYFDFCKKKAAVLFATDIAARGLDFPNVDWVMQVRERERERERERDRERERERHTHRQTQSSGSERASYCSVCRRRLRTHTHISTSLEACSNTVCHNNNNNNNTPAIYS